MARTMVLTVCVFAVGLAVAILMTTASTNDAQNSSPDRTVAGGQPPAVRSQGSASAQLFDPNWIIAALTFALVIVAYQDWKLNRSMIELTTTIERAWIAVGETTLHSFAPGRPLGVAVTLKNTGHTPAHILALKVRVDIYGKDLKPDWPARPDYGSSGYRVEGTLMPGQDLTSYPDYSGSQLLQPFVFEDVQKGNANLYVYGCVEYVDLLSGRERETRFARKYDGPSSVANNRQIFYYAKLRGYDQAT